MLFLGYVGAVVLMVIVVALRVRDATRDPSGLRVQAVAAAHLCCGVGFACALPPIYVGLGGFAAVPNLASLIVYSAIALCLSFMQIGILAMEPDEQLRPTRHALLEFTFVSLGCMAILFAAADVHDQPHPIDFDAYYATDPALTMFQLVWWTTYSVGLVRLAAASRRIAELTHLYWVWMGMRVVVVGATFALGYAVFKAVSLAASWLGGAAEWISIYLAPSFALIGASIMAVGYLIPAAPRIIRRVMAWRHLRPLWLHLQVVSPTLSTNSPLVTSEYRWVIGVMDLMRALRDYLDPEVAQRAADYADELGLISWRRHAAIEAARIEAARRVCLEAQKAMDLAAQHADEHGLTGPKWEEHIEAVRLVYTYRGVEPLRATPEPLDTGLKLWPGMPEAPTSGWGDELDGLCRIGHAVLTPHPLVISVLAETPPPKPAEDVGGKQQ